jgi:acetylornithine deacetylase/succinyl-diaminopimelate desuccinylase-like protein
MKIRRGLAWVGLGVAAVATAATAQPSTPSGQSSIEAEALRHFQALVRMDTTSPPGNEKPAADYVAQVLEREGIPVQTFAVEAHRPNVVARLTGNGRKRPLLIMGHTDTVNVDPAKWQHPPFSAVRDGGHIYGRGTVDDKDSVTAGLMTMLSLKRNLVPLDRDVIFLAEAGEEATTEIGIEFMVEQHYDAIDAEYCLAEGGNATRVDGDVRYVGVQTAEKFPKGIDLIAHGVAGHGSVPLETNPIARLARAITAVTQWQPPVVLNDTTRAYFSRLGEIEEPAVARRYRDVLSADPAVVAAADAWLRTNEPSKASMLRTSVSPNIVQGGYRNNVIPSEARATLDVRMRPGEDPEAFRGELERLIGDDEIDVVFNGFGERPAGLVSPIDGEAFVAISRAIEAHYSAPVVPMMSTGATDMTFLRAKGIRCYGVGPAVDQEDGPLGFGAHSDQERIVEAELYRFVRFHYDAVVRLAGAAQR